MYFFIHRLPFVARGRPKKIVILIFTTWNCLPNSAKEVPSLFLIESVLVLDVNHFWGHRHKIGQVHNIYSCLLLPPHPCNMLSPRTRASSRVNISIAQLRQSPENRIDYFSCPRRFGEHGKMVLSLEKCSRGSVFESSHGLNSNYLSHRPQPDSARVYPA